LAERRQVAGVGGSAFSGDQLGNRFRGAGCREGQRRGRWPGAKGRWGWRR
jgi:hypothetical protein